MSVKPFTLISPNILSAKSKETITILSGKAGLDEFVF